jgi:hypothetical protein
VHCLIRLRFSYESRYGEERRAGGDGCSLRLFDLVGGDE